MRWFPLALLVPVVLCLPLHAFAEDEEPLKPVDPEEAPAVVVPAFSLGHIVAEDDTYPEGWTAVTASAQVPATAPSVASILDLARGAKVHAKKIDARCRSMAHGKADAARSGVLAWVTIDVKSPAFTEALSQAATANGWTLRQVGSPMRYLVAWGSSTEAAETVLAWGVEGSVRKLCQLAIDTVNTAGQQPDRMQAKAVFDKGVGILEAAGRTEPRAGLYHAWKGRMAESLAQGAGQRRDRAAFEKYQAATIEHYRKALAADAVVAPPPRMVVPAAFTAGQGLLLKQDGSLLPEVLHILRQGVAAEEHAANHFQRFGNRYNLACTLARLDKVDEAFQHFEESLRYLKTAWEAEKKNSMTGQSQLGYDRHYEHAGSDEDLAPLREDERWAPLMKKYHPEAKLEEPKKAEDEKAPEKKDG